MSQTLGQQRVKAEFNPAKNELVDQIKNKSAELIDLLDSMREVNFVQEPHLGKVPVFCSGEKQRLISIAQTEIETGCMYAVKACFS
jgi:hypothetical protein